MTINMARPRLTKAQLEAQGSWRAAGRHTPQPSTDAPEPQRPQEPRESQLWDRLVEDLRELGCLARTDSRVLTRYVDLLTQWERMIDDVRRKGTYFLSANGNETVRPAAKMLDTLANRLLQIENVLGLTPASRARINAKPPDDSTGDADAAAFLSGPVSDVLSDNGNGTH